MIPRVLSIAGTDPTGGAGVQADLKSISAFGGYGMAAVTALVAQNTLGVREVHVPPTDFLTAQLRAVSDDVEIDAVKIGMLGSAEVVAVVARWLTETRPPVVVLDPVMIATSGDRLLDADAEAAVRDLCRLADLVTPNLPELAVLVGEPVAADWDTAVAQAQALAARADTTVLLKGGHLTGEESPDAVVDAAGIHPVPGRRVATPHTHGTGCSLSSAMATLAAHGLPWPDALVRAKRWLTGALENAAELHVGRGNGPIDHLHELRPHLDLAPSWSAARLAEARRSPTIAAACRCLRRCRKSPVACPYKPARPPCKKPMADAAYCSAACPAFRPARSRFWAAASVSCLAEEASLHESHVDATGLVPAAATVAYTDHLHAVSADGSYAVLVAAVLPCFVLYTDIGARWRGTFTPDHAYADWLTAYGDETFAVSSAEASRIADAAARDASPATRAAMGHAYARSMRRELAFFEAPLRR